MKGWSHVTRATVCHTPLGCGLAPREPGWLLPHWLAHPAFPIAPCPIPRAVASGPPSCGEDPVPGSRASAPPGPLRHVRALAGRASGERAAARSPRTRPPFVRAPAREAPARRTRPTCPPGRRTGAPRVPGRQRPARSPRYQPVALGQLLEALHDFAGSRPYPRVIATLYRERDAHRGG